MDNSYETGLAHTNEEHNAWIKVDLQSDFAIKSVKVYNGFSACCQERINPFRVILLDDNSNEVGRKANLIMPSGSAGTKTVEFSDIKARFVMVQLDEHTNYLHVAEIEVTGSAV